MLIKSLQSILCLLALVAVAHGRVPPIPECTAQAWVRAPDLFPNALVEGDARVKISAECPAIDSASLGLRFKERSFVKALRSREDFTALRSSEPARLDFLFDSPWPSAFANKSALEAYEEFLTNKDLWIIKEEERAVFETTQPFSIGIEHHGVLRDAVQNFAILVPSTNFPPALPRAYGGPHEHEILRVEWIYEYFVQISFSNGTTKDISAGYTAFQTQHDPASVVRGPSSATMELKDSFGSEHVENALVANYSVEIISDSGLTFFAGAVPQFLNLVVKRTGLARRFSVPLDVSPCVMPVPSSKWATEYDMPDSHPHLGPLEFVLRDKNAASRRRFSHCSHSPIAVIMPNSSADEIQVNEIVTTTSETFTIPVELHDTHVPDFETYYQTLSNALTINLNVPRVVDKDVDLDEPYGDSEAYYGTRLFEDDEEPWVPWDRPVFSPKRAYSGSIPVVVYPVDEVTLRQRCLAANTDMLDSDQVIFVDDMVCKRPSLTHYLAEGARGPIFVDRSALQTLRMEDPAQRALRAPILKPVVSSPPSGEERVNRYYMARPGFPMYVGETWAKKVVHRDEFVYPDVSDRGCVQPPVLA